MSTPSNNQLELNKILKMAPSCEGTRACLFNLIVYTHEPRRTAYFTQMVKMIRSQFPCRIIFITANPNSKKSDFNVQTTTEKNPDGSGFLCDQIFIEASGSNIQMAYFLLLPLFVPDLPIYLLWGQDPTKDHTILPHLENFATRLIFDAEATEDLQEFSRGMLNRMEASSIEIVDMTWAKIDGWREILAQIFDSPERFDQLANTNKIEFFYNDRQSELFTHPATHAVYLQAWLSSRLGWQLINAEKTNGSRILKYQNKNTTRTIQLTPTNDSKFEAADILGIHIEGDEDYTCQIKRISSDQVEVKASNQFQCELPLLLLMPTLRSGRNFMQEIFYQKQSPQYPAILEMISRSKW